MIYVVMSFGKKLVGDRGRSVLGLLAKNKMLFLTSLPRLNHSKVACPFVGSFSPAMRGAIVLCVTPSLTST
jgi:hypothetical protein